MFDVLTIAAIADELSETLLDGRVQRVGLMDQLSLAAEVYAGGRRRMLIASADSREARIHLTASAPSFDPAIVTPFGLLLRKYVRGGVIVGIEQPPLERLIRISIAKRLQPHNAPRPRSGDRTDLITEDFEDAEEDIKTDDEGEFDATYVHLAIELMGRHSNLILVDDDGRIMESAKRVTSAMSRVRTVMPRQPYTLPPPVDKPDPRRLTTVSTEQLLAAEPGDAELAQVLVRRLRGVSPQMAREIAFRAGGSAKVSMAELPDGAAAIVARETRNLFEPLLTSAWSPRVYRKVGAVVGFSPVPLAHLEASHGVEAVATTSEAADRAIESGGAGTPTDHAQRRERLASSIRDAVGRQHARLASLREQGEKAAEVERLREWGELIYAYLWQIEPGHTELIVEDGTRVPLDPALPAKENAQAYFERYRKAQSAGEHVPALTNQAEQELAYLNQLLTLTAQAEGFAAIEALTAEWEARRGPTKPAPGKKGPKQPAAAKRPKPLLDREGNAIYIGQSGRQNDAVTFDIAGPDDTWLHARGVPGSHVIVRWLQSGGEEEPETIEAAAALAAHYSSARGSASVEVDFTRRRYVRKIKGAGPGMVTYRNERTIAVRPLDPANLGEALRSEDRR